MKNYPIKLTPFEIIIWKSDASAAVKEESVKMSGGVYPGCHPSQAPGHSGAGHEAGAGDLDPGTSLEQGEWNPLLCFLCHQVRLSRKDRGTQSMMSFNRLTGSPASSPATTLSVLTASRAGVWMASCRVQSVGESLSQARSHNVPASVWPQSNCYRKVTSLRDGHSVPPTDSLLRFLVESSSDEFPSCANCDRNEKSPMFFCNTCGKWWRWMGWGAAAGTRTTTFSVAPRCNLIKKTSKLKSTTLENMKNQY